MGPPLGIEARVTFYVGGPIEIHIAHVVALTAGQCVVTSFHPFTGHHQVWVGIIVDIV
jgi:hypothetical protein